MNDLAEQDQKDWQNEEGVEPQPGYPTPRGWRLLVMPIQPPLRSKGGIILADISKDAQEYQNYCGRVIALGENCYTQPRFQGMRWCKEGDWVIYGRYAGQRVTHKGVKLLLMNDDAILATVADPRELRMYV
jgi:co-chaperonin GroES (HSP10)